MNDALAMGNYGVYVWSSFAIFAVVLLWDAIAPRLRARRFLRTLARRQQREAARKSA
jgi:heme exporter protein D